MAKKVFPTKIEPTTIDKLKKKAARLIKKNKAKSTNEMVEKVLTKFADEADRDYENYYL